MTRKSGNRGIQKTIWLQDDEKELLAGLATALGCSEADVIRHSLRMFAAGACIPGVAIQSTPLGIQRTKPGRSAALAS